MVESNFKEMELKVAIRDELRKLLPFNKLKSRNAVAIVLSYYGYSKQVN